MIPESRTLVREEGIWTCFDLEDDERLQGILPTLGSLLLRAREAAKHSYCPYSGFAVGSTVLAEGAMFDGCNIENASYGGTLCAERVALATAVAAGRRSLELIAVSTSARPGAALSERSPCGLCRQFLGEFASERTLVLLDAGNDSAGRLRADLIAFDTLMPWRFRLRDGTELDS